MAILTRMVGAIVTANSRVTALTGVFGLGLAFYLAIEPTPLWFLLLLAALVGVGAEAIVRSHPSASLSPVDTVAYLVLPVLAVLAAGIGLEEVVSGYWSVPVALVVTPPFGGLLYALYLSLEKGDPSYPLARLALNASAYLVAFAFYALAYEFELGVVAAAFVVGLTSALLSLELLREGEDDARRLSLYAGLVGLVMAQVRWAINFTPLNDLLAAAFLLTIFYLIAGLLQHFFAGILARRTLGEFAATALTALAIIIIAHAVS